MKIYQPSATIEWPTSFDGVLEFLEKAARTCYLSEPKSNPEKFLRGVIDRGHESVIEHVSVSVRIICDRTCSHQLVRHRIAAYSQESQRYCDYGKKEFGIIIPPSICPPELAEQALEVITTGKVPLPDGVEEAFAIFVHAVKKSYSAYTYLRNMGVPPEDARSVLPNCTKTELVATYNLRQWRHVFTMRCDNHAQWQIRGIMISVLKELYRELPPIFEDLSKKYLEKKDEQN